ncbi:hypothetical protein [Cryobacterium sp. PH29-G1]|uniref:hypothetical protein n=1 Tax=Cryobacterium sp. PH29-G1 TaxID=3046211 RepID=UPI0024BA592C|nr:hypothetical protein [Cryobacterium sp. PH29-G1]MDJ0348945.1 hypothetical protein [Cryobacterium sp. PH29-G1]
MATHLITYDLRAPGRDYDPVYDYIKGLGTWWHNIDSTWIVMSDLTDVQIRDGLTAVVDSDDKVLVLSLTGVGAWRGLSDTGSTWLKTNL